MTEEQYRKITLELTLGFARTLVKQNPELTFCYISGKGTDETENGRLMWARVKGKTENDLRKLFTSEYNFRPGLIKPLQGMKNTLSAYKYLPFLYPMFKALAPNSAVTLEDLGLAMIKTAQNGYAKNILECSDITLLAKN